MRWKAIRWGFVLGVVLFVGLVVYEVFKPLPKPVAGLVFMGFTHRADGNYARVCFTNMGATTVYYDCYPEVEVKTPKGPKTYDTHYYTTAAVPFLSTSNHIGLVPIPDDTIQWQAKASYSFLQRGSVRGIIIDWAVRHWQGPTDSKKEFCGWVLDHLPNPKWVEGETSTALLTNLPPAVIKP